MNRGYTLIGLSNPKTPANVGSVMRACGVYGSSGAVYTGKRYQRSQKFVTDPQKNHRHIPLTHVDDLKDAIPFDCVPIAVDLIDGATPLTEYKHPERAFYIFGPEDGTLGRPVTDWCRDVVYVPGEMCMNLAATVNVVLYDRMCKAARSAV